MATYTKFQCFVEDLAEKKHNLASAGRTDERTIWIKVTNR